MSKNAVRSAAKVMATQYEDLHHPVLVENVVATHLGVRSQLAAADGPDLRWNEDTAYKAAIVMALGVSDLGGYEGAVEAAQALALDEGFGNELNELAGRAVRFGW